jgi:hypothetical protein
MIQLQAIVELEVVADAEPRAWRIPEGRLVARELLDGERELPSAEWSWERPRVTWRGSGDPPMQPRMVVELASGEAKPNKPRAWQWPNLVGLAALIGALGGVGVQWRQARNMDGEIATLEVEKAELAAAAEQHAARLEALSQRIQDEGLCGTRPGALEARLDDCLLTLQRSVEKAAEGELIYGELDRLP